MGVLRFDGTDDRLRWTTLASGLLNVSDGAWTVGVLVKRAVVTTNFDGISYLLSGSGDGTTEAGISFTTADRIMVDVAALNSITATDFASTASPYMIVTSKAAGSVAPRTGWKLGSGGAWTHENHDVAVPDQIDATMLDIGVWQGSSDALNGWIGVVGWWEGAMSDADKEALDNNWRTSDWWNSAHGTPAFLAELNVAAGSVTDLAGNASSTSHVGTSLDSGETLDSWNFNGTGAAAGDTTVKLRSQYLDFDYSR